MKKVFIALAAMLFASSAHAAVKVGAKNSLSWYLCFDEASAVQVIDTAKAAGLQESYKIWGLLTDGGKCVALSMPVPMQVVKVVKSNPIDNEEYSPGVPLVLSVLELSDGKDAAWAITGEPVE